MIPARVGAQRARRSSARAAHAVRGETVHARRVDVRVSGGPGVPVALVIGHDEQDVGTVRSVGRAGKDRPDRHQEEKHPAQSVGSSIVIHHLDSVFILSFQVGHPHLESLRPQRA